MNTNETNPPCRCGATPEADCPQCGAPYITGNYPPDSKFTPSSNKPLSAELLDAEARLEEVKARLNDAVRGPTKPTFHAHGKDWFPHTPGDPCPVAPTVRVHIIMRSDYDEGEEIRPAGDYMWTTIERTPRAEIIGWSYEDPQPESAESAESVTDELARLREENAKMRTAINAAHESLIKYGKAGVGNSTDYTTQVSALSMANKALQKLQPFTQP